MTYIKGGTLPAELQTKRQPCSIFTRTMGYYSALRTQDVLPDGTHGSLMNIGKRGEHYSREYFDYNETMDSLTICEKNKEFCMKN